MDRNGDSIYGATYGPIQGRQGVRSTAKGQDIFLHVFDWPGTKLEISSDNLPKVRSAQLLATGTPVTFRQENNGLTITLPEHAPDEDVTVIAMKQA